jgi:phosphoglycolate phosphatase-like HAD superfamily hydrolase
MSAARFGVRTSAHHTFSTSPLQNFDPDDPGWVREKSGLFGARWPDVRRLLDALRQYGIHYTDVTANKLRV